MVWCDMRGLLGRVREDGVGGLGRMREEDGGLGGPAGLSLTPHPHIYVISVGTARASVLERGSQPEATPHQAKPSKIC